MTVDQEELDEQSWSSRVLDRTKWSKKEYVWLVTGILMQAFIFSFESNLYGGVVPTPTAMFQATSLTAILPTIWQIVSAVMIPFFAKFSDVIGRAEALTISMVFNILGYVLHGTAHGFGQLAAGKFILAIGTTGFEVLSFTLLVDTTPLKDRGIFFSLWGLGYGTTIWIAQLLIDPLTVHGNWRNGFVICTVLSFIGSVGALAPLWYLQRKGEKALGRRSRRSFGWFLNEFDVVGAMLLAATAGLLLFPLMVARRLEGNFKNPVIIGCLCGGAVALVFLVIWERKYTNRPIIPMRILTQRTCLGGLCTTLISAVMTSMNYMYFTVYLVVSRKLTFGQAFLLERGFQMGYLGSAVVAGVLMRKFNATRRFVWIGLSLATLGTALMIPARLPGSSDFFVVISQTIGGIGTGTAANAALVTITGAVHRRDSAAIIASHQILGSMGGALAGALAGSVWTQLLPARIERYVDGEYDMFKAINSPDYVKALPEPTYSQVIRAYGDAQMVLSIMSCCLFVFAGMATLMMEKIDLNQTQDEQDAKYGGVELSKKDPETADQATDQPVEVLEDEKK